MQQWQRRDKTRKKCGFWCYTIDKQEGFFSSTHFPFHRSKVSLSKCGRILGHGRGLGDQSTFLVKQWGEPLGRSWSLHSTPFYTLTAKHPREMLKASTGRGNLPLPLVTLERGAQRLLQAVSNFKVIVPKRGSRPGLFLEAAANLKQARDTLPSFLEDICPVMETLLLSPSFLLCTISISPITVSFLEVLFPFQITWRFSLLVLKTD